MGVPLEIQLVKEGIRRLLLHKSSATALQVELVKEDKKRYLPLLLLADPEEAMVDRYLERGDLYLLLEEGECRGLCVVTEETPELVELKNLAVEPAYQGRGYGHWLVGQVCERYRGRYRQMQVGTADIDEAILRFYEGCGFQQSHRVANFFVEHYSEPVYDKGRQCVDMIYLVQDL